MRRLLPLVAHRVPRRHGDGESEPRGASGVSHGCHLCSTRAAGPTTATLKKNGGRPPPYRSACHLPNAAACHPGPRGRRRTLTRRGSATNASCSYTAASYARITPATKVTRARRVDGAEQNTSAPPRPSPLIPRALATAAAAINAAAATDATAAAPGLWRCAAGDCSKFYHRSCSRKWQMRLAAFKGEDVGRGIIIIAAAAAAGAAVAPTQPPTALAPRRAARGDQRSGPLPTASRLRRQRLPPAPRMRQRRGGGVDMLPLPADIPR